MQAPHNQTRGKPMSKISRIGVRLPISVSGPSLAYDAVDGHAKGPLDALRCLSRYGVGATDLMRRVDIH